MDRYDQLVYQLAGLAREKGLATDDVNWLRPAAVLDFLSAALQDEYNRGHEDGFCEARDSQGDYWRD